MSEVLTPKTKGVLSKIVKENRIIVLKLGADWCAPCRSSEPLFKRLAAEGRYTGVVYLSLNIEHMCQETGATWGQLFNCTGVPMFIVFFDQSTHETFVGADFKPLITCIATLHKSTLQTTVV